MLVTAWKLLVETTLSFIEDEALGRGAAIAFYAITSLAPVLLIAIAVAGLAFGHDAAQGTCGRERRNLLSVGNRRLLCSVIDHFFGGVVDHDRCFV